MIWGAYLFVSDVRPRRRHINLLGSGYVLVAAADEAIMAGPLGTTAATSQLQAKGPTAEEKRFVARHLISP